jgi:hypothetical protein
MVTKIFLVLTVLAAPIVGQVLVSSIEGMDTALILRFGSQPKQTLESAENDPSLFFSKTQLHSTQLYFPDPGQYF